MVRPSQVAVLLMAAGMAALGARAHAQSSGATPPPPQPANQGQGANNTVFVTAERRAANIQKVPIAVTAFTAKQRDILGIQTLQDLTDFTPGLSYSTSLDRAFIRGVGRQTNNLSTQPGVATYSDGVYNSSVIAAAADTLFLDRTEVLRGPQGTLYGRNSIGGAVNAVSRMPSSTFYAEGRATVANYDAYQVEGAVSGPVNDDLRLRVATSYAEQNKGFFTNVAGGPSEGVTGQNGRSWYVEGQLDANLTPKLELWMKADAAGWDYSYRASNTNSPYDTNFVELGSLGPNALFAFNPCFGVSMATACAASPTGFGVGGSFTHSGRLVTQNPGVFNLRDFATNTPEHANLADDYNIDTHLTYHTPWDFDVKYIGGYTHYKYHLTTDFDGSNVTELTIPCAPLAIFFGFCSAADPAAHVFPSTIFNYFEQKTYFSNEVDFVSTGTSNLQWIAGLYQYEEFYDQHIDFPSPGQAQLANPIDLANYPNLAAPDPNRSYYYAGQRMKDDSYAVFGQVDWKITDTLKFTGGLRWSQDHLFGGEFFRAISWGTSLPTLEFTGDATPAYDITPFLISFAPAQGVKSAPMLLPNGKWTRNLGATWSAPTGTAGLEWTPDDVSLLYVKYSRGYKSGGYNAGYINAAPETGPETLDAFEIGGKRQWFDRKLTTNLALFYYDYKGMQIPLSVQPSSGPAQTLTYNMKQVISYGLELETIWVPIEHATILFDYSYLNTRIHDNGCFLDSDDPSAVAPGAHPAGCPVNGMSGIFVNQYQSVNGEQIPEAPNNKIALNGAYTFVLEPGSLTLSASFIWKDKTYDSIFNRAYNLAKAYDQVDLTATWTDTKNRYTIILFGKNVFNTLGTDGVAGVKLNNQPYALYQSFGLIPPATYGVQLQVRFR